ncbi:3-oxoacyl-ACP synthase III family protein [Dyella lutea]|uniref:Ketoacyl-ACP synthase III n=1 Tax=Dyella lutea TaxID=2950441 RepID=A0ABT1F9P0_9GAMM|nr:ketoacyl-ACP synthase III [Dyella lutea]MCP1374079.1 ketoacyl-ACP synthase III [Dyella lutea]
MTDIYINDIGTALGSLREQNDAQSLGQAEADCLRIVDKTGIRSRPVAAEHEYSSDLACTATNALLTETGTVATDVGALLVCTQTPDHLIPGVSSRVHGRLGFPKSCFVLDINQGCSGFVIGTQVMTNWLRATGGSGILVNADTYSKLVRPHDLTTRVIFGDAATATMLSTRRGGFRVVHCRSFADGSGYDAFVARGSALRNDQHQQAGIYMDGPGILNFALQAVPDAITQTLADVNRSLGDIRMVLFHQANRFIIGQLAKKLKLAKEQTPCNYSDLGNTVSASIPLLLKEQMNQLQPGDLVLTVGFGVGLSWGAALLERVKD